MYRGHQTVIILGIGCITITLVGFYLVSQKASESDSTQAQIISGTASLTPTPETKVVSSKITPSTTPTTTVLPSVTASVTPTPSATPIRTIIIPPPAPSAAVSTAPSSPLPSPTFQNTGNVVINEIAWMGTDDSATDEWLEFFNPTDTSIDLTGWVLKSETDDSPHIILEGTIPAFGYFVLERTNDEVISDLVAQMALSFGTGGLKNSGEVLLLVNAQGVTVDQAGSSSSWYAGTASPRATMERVSATRSGSDPGNWATNNGVIMWGYDHAGDPIKGTPGRKNSATP